MKIADDTSDAPPSRIPVRNLWHMLLYAWGELRHIHRWSVEAEAAPTLDALLSVVLADLMHQRMRVGIGRDYRKHSDVIRGIRGRLDFSDSLRRLAFQHGKASCRFETFSENVPRNQVIRSTLARLALIGEFGTTPAHAQALRHRLRVLVQGLGTVDLIDLHPETIRRLQMQRHDADYRAMLAICHLVAQRQMPTEQSGHETVPGLNRDEMTLHRVFEKFVGSFYRFHLNRWKVASQAQFSWPASATSQYLPKLVPDVVLTHRESGDVVILDTKFTAGVLSKGQWGGLTFNRDHLFQIYAYVRSQEHLSANHRTATGILLYPTASHSVSETVEVQGHKICWRTIDLMLDWTEIENNLLAIIAEHEPEVTVNHG